MKAFGENINEFMLSPHFHYNERMILLENKKPILITKFWKNWSRFGIARAGGQVLAE